jgi:exopolyphosphatase/guanosine-5'-triphosphate,3'-diphosphate pyrophosphatase
LKVSVIDLGFNSVKLVNYEVSADNFFKPYEQEGIKVKLGEGLSKTGNLNKEAIQRTIDGLKLFRDIINLRSIKHVLPVATSAVREARNKLDFLKEVYEETGFQFKVLSEREEALCSYTGALRSTCFPTALFFDLGGGSLEMIYTENFRIKKLRSLPLGALRLSQAYGRKEGTFSDKNYEKMERHVLKVLPDRKELDMSPDTTLVGVGGTLRAMARYDQEIKEYQLGKIHNYRMAIESIDSINKRLCRMTADEMSKIDAIGNGRIETVTAGSCVIKSIMEKFRFGKIVVSAQGLREGILAIFLENSKGFHAGDVNQDAIQNFVKFSCEPEVFPEHTESLVKSLISNELINERERVILTHAIRKVSQVQPVTNLHNLFYMLIDEDNAYLSHREQIVMALSIIRTRKIKTADWLFARYGPILKPQNRKSIQKLASCIVLSDIFEKVKAKVKFDASGKKFEMKITSKSAIPKRLLENAIKDFETAFDISVAYSLSNDSRKTNSQLIKINERK